MNVVGMGQEGSGLKKMEGESTGRDNWNLGTSLEYAEPYCSGNFQESTKLTLVKTLAMGVMEFGHLL